MIKIIEDSWDELKALTTGVENWGGGGGGGILSTVCMDLYNCSITVLVILYKHSGSLNGKSMQCCTVHCSTRSGASGKVLR